MISLTTLSATSALDFAASRQHMHHELRDLPMDDVRDHDANATRPVLRLVATIAVAAVTSVLVVALQF